ncbi:MAG: tetratricopeptide repeat protein [Crocinitomicaceae bacterium]|nr:tetratricopeptide repeat protein [Crocinitomicaceae bacterium]
MIFRLFIIALFLPLMCVAQDEIKRNLYYGNQAFNEGDYEKAADYYLDAVNQSPLNFKANYNLANAYYRLNQNDKAIERMNTVVNLAPTSFDKAKAYHNIGNAHMMKQELDEAIEAYKNALRLNPSDEETRYNLAYAQQMKQKQDQQQKQNQQDQSNGGDGQNMGDNQNQENQNQENQENGDENNDSGNDQEEKDGDQGDQEEDGNSDQQPQDRQDQDGSGQSYSAKLSKEQIENILNAYYQREKELQKKLNNKKKVGYGSPQKKDW